MSGCGCKGAQAAARAAIDNGSVAGTVDVLAAVLNPYAVFAPPPQSTTQQDTTAYNTGVFVQTGKK